MKNLSFPGFQETQFFEDPLDGFIIYPLGTKPVETLRSNERLGVRPDELTRLFTINVKKYADRFVVLQPVTVQNPTYFNLHRLLRAIDKNVLLSQLDPKDCCSPDETFMSPDQLLKAFQQYAFIVTNTYRLMDGCNIEMDFETDKNKQIYGGAAQDDIILLEKLAVGGLFRRYGKKNKPAAESLKRELKVITDLGFVTYFLINYDLVRFGESQDY